MSIESVMSSNHLVLCYPLLLPPSIFPSIRVFSNESHIGLLLFSHCFVWLFETQRTAARQASLSITIYWSLLKLMSIESVMPSNHLVLYCPILFLPLIFPSIRVFSNSQLFASDGQSIGVSASTSVLPINTQDWFPLGWTGLISLQSKGLSRVFSTPQFKSINSSVLSLLYNPTLTSIHDHWKNQSFD